MTASPKIQNLPTGWQLYADILTSYNVIGEAQSQYLEIAKSFLGFTNNKPLSDVTSKDLFAFFVKHSPHPSLADQIQTIRAIKLLLVDAAGIDWASDFDWLEQCHGKPGLRALTLSKTRGERVDAAFPGVVRNLRQRLQQHLSARTENSYVHWVERFLDQHLDNHLTQLQQQHVNQFISDLKTKDGLSASTQNLACSALSYFFKHVLSCSIKVEGAKRSKLSNSIPVVLTREEVVTVLDHLDGVNKLMIGLIYGTGMKLMECVRLRIKDIDSEENLIHISDSRCQFSRTVPLPEAFKDRLTDHMAHRKEIYLADCELGYPDVYLPESLNKNVTGQSQTWDLHYVFAASRLTLDPRSNKVMRNHIHASVLQRVLKSVGKHSGVTKDVNSHTLRHSFAVHLLEAGVDVRQLQEMLGHSDISLTMLYEKLIKPREVRMISPADLL